jgi:hypothetical protein
MKHSTPSNDASDMNSFGSAPTGESGGEISAGSRKSTRKKKKAPAASHSDLADASISQMLSDLLDKIFVTQDLSELNTIAAILQKLLASSQQVLVMRDQQGSGTDVASRVRDGLDMPAVRQLERQLKLL